MRTDFQHWVFLRAIVGVLRIFFGFTALGRGSGGTAAALLALCALVASVGPVRAQTVFLSFSGSSASDVTDIQSFGESTLKPGQTVTITASGPPGAEVVLFVGDPEVTSVIIPQSGSISRTFTVETDYDGAVSVVIFGGSSETPTTFTIQFIDNDTPPPPPEPEPEPTPSTNGQAAADQASAVGDTILPGGNSFPDLGEVFGIPDAFGDQLAAGLAGLGRTGQRKDGAVQIPAGQAQNRNAQGQGQNPQPRNRNAGNRAVAIVDPREGFLEGEAVIGLDGRLTATKIPCGPLIKELEDKIAEKNDEVLALLIEADNLDRINGLKGTDDASVREVGRNLDEVIAAAEEFVEAIAQELGSVQIISEGPVPNIDDLAAAQAILEHSIGLRGFQSSVETEQERIEDARQQITDAKADLEAARKRMQDAAALAEATGIDPQKLEGAIAETEGDLGFVGTDDPAIAKFVEFHFDLSTQFDEVDAGREDIIRAVAAFVRARKDLPNVEFDVKNAEATLAVIPKRIRSDFEFQQVQELIDDFSGGLDFVADKRRAEAKKAEAEAEALKKELEDLIRKCSELQQGAQSIVPTVQPAPPVAFAARSTGRAGGQLAFSISTRGQDTGLDPRLNIFFNGTLTFHDDGRAGVGQDGETYALAGGVSWLLTPDVNVGIVGRYAISDLSGNSGSTDADTASIGAFVQTRLSDTLFLDIVGAYTHADLSSVFVQPASITTGSPEISSFAAQAKLSGRIESDSGLIISPSVGASYLYADQDAFLLSDGTLAPGRTSERLSLQSGATVSKSYRNAAGTQTITPSFGLTAFANLTGTQSFLLPNGTFSSSGTFGATATAGLSVQTDSGATISFAGNATSFEKGQNSFGLSLSATIPLN